MLRYAFKLWFVVERESVDKFLENFGLKCLYKFNKRESWDKSNKSTQCPAGSSFIDP